MRGVLYPRAHDCSTERLSESFVAELFEDSENLQHRYSDFSELLHQRNSSYRSPRASGNAGDAPSARPEQQGISRDCPQAEPAVDQVLKNVGVHVVRLQGQSFCVVVPDGHSEAIVEFDLAQSHPGCSNGIRMDIALLVENVVIVAARKRNNREIELREVENIELFCGIE